MKRLLSYLLASFMVVAAANATITRVQSANNTTGSSQSNTVTVTFSSNLTVGNWVVIVASLNQGAHIRLSSYPGLAYRLLPNGNGTGPTLSTIIWFQVTTAGQAGVGMALFNATTASIAVVACEYQASNLMMDVGQSAASAGASTAPVTGSITTTYANELIVACLAERIQSSTDNTSWLSSPTNSFSIVDQHTTTNNVANTDRAVAYLERITTSTVSSITAGGTSANVTWSGNFVTFREIAGSAFTNGQ